MKVLFATAELAPYVKVGGLADFSSGLTRMLRAMGVEVQVVLPDYGIPAFEEHQSEVLQVPEWASPASARTGTIDGERITLISFPGSERPNPYLDSDGEPWPDLDLLFFRFSAATAELARATEPSVLHVNDWHTSPTLGLSEELPPTVLTVHNLAYQGESDPSWIEKLPHDADAFRRSGHANPLAGGVALADVVVAVSPHYASETVEDGFGLEDLLAGRGSAYVGILNGIDTSVWDPSSDPHLPANYDDACSAGKTLCKRVLLEEIGWPDSDSPLIGMVTRLTDQKGVDLVLEILPELAERGARLFLLGSGERALADAARSLADEMGDAFYFHDGYDESLSHRVFGASDMYLMPSRFEPAGLTQMQAMRYGAIPVVTDVGGLSDTVSDADAAHELGNGFVAESVSSEAVAEAMRRALDAWGNRERWCSIVANGMAHDWSWEAPARQYLDVYRQVTSAGR